MTLDQIRKAVGRQCSLLDGSGNFVDGLVLEADLTALANERWKFLHLKFANKYPEAITIPLNADLVEDQSQYVLNADGYTEFDLVYVGIMYDTDSEYYTRVRPRSFKVINKDSTDTSGHSQLTPYYYPVAAELEGDEEYITKRAIEIVPAPDTAVTDGLLYHIIEMPADMEEDDDIPYTLPAIMHSLIVDYMVADVWQIKRDWANSNEAMGRASYNEKRFFDEYQVTSSDMPVRLDIGKRFTPNIR
jgi:hypothetical protein